MSPLKIHCIGNQTNLSLCGQPAAALTTSNVDEITCRKCQAIKISSGRAVHLHPQVKGEVTEVISQPFHRRVTPAAAAGKRFQLNEQILGIELLMGERKAVSIPRGMIIEAVCASSGNSQIIDVLWEQRTLEILACDLHMRGIELVDPQRQSADYTALQRKKRLS